MKNILIPVDFSDQSWNTALCAINLYKNAGMRFYLFFSEERDYLSNEAPLQVKNAASKLTAWVKRLEKLAASGQVVIPLKWESDFIADTKAAVAENNIDLIVMSTHYPNIFCEVHKGSHVREVITRIKRPVLIIPREYCCSLPKQVVLLTDFNFKHRAQPISVVTSFIKRAGAHLNILQLSKTGNALSEAQKANKQFLQSALDTISHSFHFVIEKSMDEALQFFVDVQQVDLVVLFAKNINLSENILFTPGLKRDIDYHKTIPFLIVHE